jgi:histidinol-phosphate aminotransferase
LPDATNIVIKFTHMNANRRSWIKKAGLSLASLTVLNNLSNAMPVYESDDFYLPPDTPIKLTSNENPYGPSPMARKAMAKAINNSNRYPWDDTTLLREKLGTKFGLTKEHVIIGAGSSEILGLIGQLIAKDKSHFVAADLTFRIWRRATIDLGATITRTDLTADKKHDLAALEKATTPSTKLIYICNPNNPTGTIVDAPLLKNFIEEMSRKHIIVIDEAYLEYTSEPTMASFVATNKNVIVVKTFSKMYGLAGARIGYGLAHPDTITLLNSMQPWPNAGASACAVAAGSASLDDTSFSADVLAKNNAVKLMLYDFYKSKNIAYIPSYTNFVYYSVAQYKGDFPKDMESRKILCGGITEEKEKWTRITIGTENEMKQYIKTVNEIWK